MSSTTDRSGTDRSAAPWLADEPATKRAVGRALCDVFELLDYLGRLPEARIDQYFGPAPPHGGVAALKPAEPPCASYAEFMDCLIEINAAYQTGDASRIRATLPAPRGVTGPGIAPTAIGFLYRSRDFLSVVAAPATAQSIRLTEDFIRQRAQARCRCLFRPRARVATTTAPVTAGDDPDVSDRLLLSRSLARRVAAFDWMTLGAVIITALISIYALSGRLALDAEKYEETQWAPIDQKITIEEQALFTADHAGSGGQKLVEAALTDAATTANRSLCDTQIDSASNGVPDRSVTHTLRYVLPAADVHLCDARAAALRRLFTATVHLQSWSSIVTERMGSVGLPFGIAQASLREYANTDIEGCRGAAPSMFPDKADPTEQCVRALLTLMDRSRNVAESILGSITHYLLPVCYGFLGAMAATMRQLRMRIATAQVHFTDRGRLQQGALLGVLCGAVIGLFASSFDGDSTAAGLSIPAIAFLAGYNVRGVFRFLDDLSDRLFGGKPAAKA